MPARLLALALTSHVVLEPVAPSPAGACPSEDAVRAHTPSEDVRGAQFVVEDAGTRFVVRTDRESRTFEEPLHDCEARAKMAAVALMAMLAPPYATDVPTRPEPSTTPPRAAPLPPSAPPPESPPWWELALGARTELAPGFDARDDFVSTGVEIRGVVRPSWYGVGLGAAWYFPASFGIAGTYARQTRAVFDLGAHVEGSVGGGLRVRFTLGPALDIHDVRGTAADADGGASVLLGARTSLELALSTSRHTALAVDVGALLFPIPGELALHSADVIGHDPAVYVGPTFRFWYVP